MFSGIKSILFGTSDQQPQAIQPSTDKASSNPATAYASSNSSPDTSIDAAANNEPCDPAAQDVASSNNPSQLILNAIQERTGFKRTDTSALIEQTLNAAASLVTEQLLPQSASIEQLQSNSRQLLPALAEQPAPDSLLCEAELESENEQICSSKSHHKDDDDDDDDDTWELLDLIDTNNKQEHSSWSQVPKCSTTTCGTGPQEPKRFGDKRQRGAQKLRVTFETPDLVTVESAETVSTEKENYGYDKNGVEFTTLKDVVTQTEEHQEVTMVHGKSALKKQSITRNSLEEADNPTVGMLNKGISEAEFDDLATDSDAGSNHNQEEEEEYADVNLGNGQLSLASKHQIKSITTTETTAKLKPQGYLNCGYGSQSDLTEMDESWYVTPPPCFTGSNYHNFSKSKSPKATNEAARENALIEHPSIYISGGSILSVDGEYLVERNDEQRQPVEADVDELASSSHEEVEVMLNLINEEDFDDVDDRDAEDDDVADVSEIDADEEEAVGGTEKETELALLAMGKGDFSQNSAEIIDHRAERVKEKSLDVDASDELSREASAQLNWYRKATSNPGSFIQELWTSEQAKPIDNAVDMRPESRASSYQTDCSAAAAASTATKKTSVQVRPIQPERLPGWQLRRRRPKRRPLSAILVQSNNSAQQRSPTAKTSASIGAQKSSPSGKAGQTRRLAPLAPMSAVKRDTPALINRIGSSIVANLNNLTNGLPMRSQVMSEETEKLSQTMMRKATEPAMSPAQRRLDSKSYLDRQNACIKVANSKRRADRRLKMYTTPNGVSINRKVHTSFH